MGKGERGGVDIGASISAVDVHVADVDRACRSGFQETGQAFDIL